MKWLNRCFVFLLVLMVSCKVNHSSNGKTNGKLSIGFYNVENLFDTLNDPLINDDDFTPNGKLSWNTSKYNEKLDRIGQVIAEMPGGMADIMGLCEVENKKVVEDLIRSERLKNSDWGIVHYDSPDERGIDVALIFNSSKVKIVRSEPITLTLDGGDRTRDILHVVFQADSEHLHFFVNHWPSRSGGQMESEPARIRAAQLLASEIDKIKKLDSNAKVVCMGDFNDHPTDKSIASILGASGNLNTEIYDFMYDDHVRGEGTHWYKGEWGALDQFMATATLLSATKGWTANEESAQIVRNDYLFFQDKEGTKRPNRSYAGEVYKGGYSDHLPIHLMLVRK